MIPLQDASGLPTPEFAQAVGITTHDGISVAAVPLPVEVSASDPGVLLAISNVLTREMRELEDLKGRLLSGPEDVLVGDLPGFAFRFSFLTAYPPFEIRTLVTFKGRMEYLVQCKWTNDHASEIQLGCNLVQQTFRAD